LSLLLLCKLLKTFDTGQNVVGLAFDFETAVLITAAVFRSKA